MMRFRPGSWVGIAGIVGMTLTLAGAGCSSSSSSGAGSGAANCSSAGTTCNGQAFQFCYTGASSTNCTGAYYTIGSQTIECTSCSQSDLATCTPKAAQACVPEGGTSSSSSGSSSGGSSGSSSGSSSGGSSGSSSGAGDAGGEGGGGHPMPGACSITCQNGEPNNEMGCDPCLMSNCASEYAACEADLDMGAGCISCYDMLQPPDGSGGGFFCANTMQVVQNLLACACQSTTCD